MLSYMIPVDTADKPPPAPQKPPAAGATQQTHLNLNLTHAQHPNQIQILTNGNGTTTSATGVHRSCLVTNMSKDSSVNSFASDVTTGTGSSASGAATPISGAAVPCPMPGYKNKLVMVTSNCGGGAGGGGGGHQQLVQVAGGKHHSLKRVSFGSSKGSMVETLIYESPLQEEPEPSPIPENGTPFPEDGDQTEDERERVRVSFVQHSKPQEVQLPDEPVILTDSEFMMAAAAIAESNHVITTYTRQESTESGWDNPFRPGGDLSREADEIVELIKGGKPITPTSATAPTTTTDGILPNSSSNKSPVALMQESLAKKSNVANAHQSPSKNGSSGATPTSAAAKNGGIENKGGGGGAGGASAVNVQRGTTGQPSADVEHVVLKKEKSKCKCCVVQ